ncbi:beta-glucosidase BglX [Paludibacter sp.]
MKLNQFFTLTLLLTVVSIQTIATDNIDRKVQELLSKMTLEEKAGQLNQISGNWKFTGPISEHGDVQELIKKGHIGSMLNVKGVGHTRQVQELAMQSRLGIPLIFGLDVIHGYRTMFPTPLAQAASWDLVAIEKAERIAAIEASASGIHWTFAPMVDIARDPRWGRIVEGSGEDAYLGSLIAKARVRGFQGEGLGNMDAIMACAKHFAAYGAALAGRDYNTVDMSLMRLHETYLPPFKAAIDAGVATFMSSFNDLNGIPATGNTYLLREVLKKQWNFDGFVVSDWASIKEMIAHGYATDNRDAAKKAIIAGCDMDMEGGAYVDHLVDLVNNKIVSEKLINESVSRILRKKFELGLFDDPYKFCDSEREKKQRNNANHLEEARKTATKSIVLLKNEGNILPLAKNTKKIALIGPFFEETTTNLGAWSIHWDDDKDRIVTQYNGIAGKVSKRTKLLYAKGCNVNDDDKSAFDEAVKTALQADVVVMSIGETYDMSGEAKSRTSLDLPGVQEELFNKIVETGKPVIVLVNAGRPLTINAVAQKATAILYKWQLGTEAGNAIADVLFGDYNPAAKLPITFPRNVGQIPLFYNNFNTGRPVINNNTHYRSAYIDSPNTPLYPFGFGLSYTEFKYDNFKLSSERLQGNQSLKAQIDVSNTGRFDGEEIVQLYIRDITASVVRPLKELKGFEKIFLKKGETKTVEFTITPEDLKFFNDKLDFDWESGDFQIMIGRNSADLLSKNIYWEKE